MSETIRGGQVISTPARPNPPQGPWWQHRKPITDAERLEYAALTWAADANLERAMVVRERHRDVYSPLSPTIRMLEEYEKRRAAAVEFGKQLQLPPIDLEAIDAAAAFLRSTPERPNPDAVNRAQQVAFRDVARTGDWPAIAAAFLAWGDALDEARSALGRWWSAHEVLGQGRTHGDYTRSVPRLSDALDGAFGYGPRPAPMLPEE